jgi:Fe-S cluster biosynthesis and repair protein YggX
MKTILLTILFSIVICTGCEKDPVIVKGFYDSMHFVRQGGGQIDFSIYPTENFDQVNAVVTKYSYRDTTIQITILLNDNIASTFSSLNQAMNNQIQINGDFQQSTLHTGTWSYIYMVDDTKETEVTNTDLRNSLHKFEQLVREKIQ